MELFLIYLWLKLDTFRGILMFFVVFLAFLWLWRHVNVGICIYDSEKKDTIKAWGTKHTKCLLMSICLLVVHTLIPSAKDTAILVGSSFAIDMAKSPEGAKIGKLIRQKANDFLDEELNKAVKPTQENK